MSGLNEALDAIDSNLEASMDRLFSLLRIESVSTDPAYKEECHKAGQFLVDQLNGLGFDASLRKRPDIQWWLLTMRGRKGRPTFCFTATTMCSRLILSIFGTRRRLSPPKLK